MKRKLYNALIKWKNDPDRKPLVLEGARQVGKTWLLTGIYNEPKDYSRQDTDIHGRDTGGL